MNSNWVILMWGNELLLVMAFLVSLLVLLLLRRVHTTSLLALVSVCCAIFNPYVAHRLLGLLGANTCWRLYFPSMFVVPLIAVVCGHFALRRIKQSQTPLHGRSLAWIGCSLGYASLVCSLGYIGIYALGWSGVKG